MKPSDVSHKARWLPIALLLLLPACATVSPPLPPSVIAPPAIPPLPLAARQPAPPELCMLTCSDGLSLLLDSLLLSPGSAATPARSASSPTTR